MTIFDFFNSSLAVLIIGAICSLILNYVTFRVLIAEMNMKIQINMKENDLLKKELDTHIFTTHDKDTYIQETLALLKQTVENHEKKQFLHEETLKLNTNAINSLTLVVQKIDTSLDFFMRNKN